MFNPKTVHVGAHGAHGCTLKTNVCAPLFSINTRPKTQGCTWCTYYSFLFKKIKKERERERGRGGRARVCCVGKKLFKKFKEFCFHTCTTCTLFHLTFTYKGKQGCTYEKRMYTRVCMCTFFGLCTPFRYLISSSQWYKKSIKLTGA